MTRLRATLAASLFFVACLSSLAQTETNRLRVSYGQMIYRPNEQTVQYLKDVMLNWKGAIMTADAVSFNELTSEATADGNVRIQQGEQVWTGDHISYNFKTQRMEAEKFRTGKPPVFAAGEGLAGDTNGTYSATNAFITADDIAKPLIKMRAKRIHIIPGKRIEAKQATLWIGDVPIFYFPFYSRNLGFHANNFNFIPGYRSAYGPFLLGNYTWFLNDEVDGMLHLDYRERRGVGTGPDVNLHLGRWGEATFKYYYTHDDQAATNAVINAPVFENRQRLEFSYLAAPFTNLEVRSAVRYQSDMGVVHDFFEGDYRQNPQPNTFVEVNKFWQNFSLDVLTQPRINNFYETVERLPDVRLTGFRQQIGVSPLYYESETSVGYYRRLFAETNFAPAGLNFAAGRADTYHQITLPETFFGWLNVTPRAGGRLTYYTESSGPAAINEELTRGVFNTGAEVSFKASRLWPGVENKAFDLDGLRHIVEPSVNYVYVPKPNYTPDRLPQFDYELPSLRLLPIEFPEYNAIDSIDSQNVMRFGLRNRLQTKRQGVVDDALDWDVQMDWRLRPRSDQKTFADVYSDLTLKPRTWLRFQSQTRFDPNAGDCRMALDTVTIEPNDVWSWTIGQFYLRNDFSSSPTALGEGNNLVTSSLYYRVNENWGLRATHHFDALHGRMQEQYYTIYRDMRSWTAALTAGLRDNGTGPKDFTIAFTFSVKAMPRFGLGRDTVRPYSLLGQ